MFLAAAFQETDDDLSETTVQLLSLGDTYEFWHPLAPQLAMGFSAGKIPLSKVMQLLVLQFLKLAEIVDKAATQFSLEDENTEKHMLLQATLLTRGGLMVACADGLRHVLHGEQVVDYVPPYMAPEKRAELTNAMAKGDFVKVSKFQAHIYGFVDSDEDGKKGNKIHCLSYQAY